MFSRALFLDRDGVINHDYGHVSRIENFIFLDGIFELCRAAIQRDYLLFIVTNQGGIGRGLYTEEDFSTLMKWVCARFAEAGVAIEKVYYAPFHPELGVGKYRRESEDRKPNPGMLCKAQAAYGLDMGSSMMIGDKDTDMIAAKNAGVATRVFMPADSTTPSASATHRVRKLLEVMPLLSPDPIPTHCPPLTPISIPPSIVSLPSSCS